ncbi:MAG TPA: envelope fusion protein, partial [Nitrososphaeraceae archaeon]
MKNNPGILPFKLGNAKILNYYRTFIHYYELKEISNQLETINNQYNKLKVNIITNLNSTHHAEIQNYDNVLYFQTNNAKLKLDNLLSDQNKENQDNRSKRGLINFLGSVIKFITGNLDEKDKIKYDNLIDNLHKNQENLILENNHQISLTKDLIANYNKTIKALILNEKTIANDINDLQGSLREAEFEFHYEMFLKSIFDQLNFNLNIIIQLLQDLENAITFAKLGIPHYSIISRKEFNTILTKLIQDIPEEQLLFPSYNISKYFEITKVKAYIRNTRIVFILSIPIVLPDIYSYYYLFSIPIRCKDNSSYKTLILEEPYFLANNKHYMFHKEKCVDVDKLFYCEKNNLLNGYEQTNCMFNILNNYGNYSECRSTNIIVESNVINQIDKINYICVL